MALGPSSLPKTLSKYTGPLVGRKEEPANGSCPKVRDSLGCWFPFMAVPQISSTEIRQSFLDFFAAKQHAIVPSSSLLPDSPNLLFTNAGMNQFVPIFLGEQKCPYTPGRAADTQKCIRAGGKHNDLEDVGLDTYHHTFFEMLGNWSFGDYFKKEAIQWAWELLTEKWGFPKNRLYATVYRPGAGEPAEEDAEAFETWSELFRSAGLDPAVHVIFSGKKDNFWMMGETGPCGPCSELHVDLTSGGDTRGALVNRGTSECIEIWNLVFIQFNANPDGTFSPLPARHVDTGMGFERVCAIMQGTKGFTDFNRPVSNYDTDVFRPLFDKLSLISGREYKGTFPDEATLRHQTPQLKSDIAFRVIADHARTLAFAISDGIHPGNTDRHYVLRRILRRAVRFGRNLGLHEPFFFKLAGVLADTMGDVFPEIRLRQSHVEEVIRIEEEAFNRTLDKGISLFQAEADKGGGAISGEFAFKLYDTYGFPLDLTQVMARERGLDVDATEFDTLMEAQRARARSAQKKEVIELSLLENSPPTDFVGYDLEETNAKVLDVIRWKNRTAVLADRSVCYAEMGGQVGDTGEMDLGGKLWLIADTRKSGAAWLHFLEDEDAPEPGSEVSIRIDTRRRAAIERHHTATHLLHWALHEVVSRDAAQKGSSVGPDKLTFDFNSAALTSAQLMDIERLVNERIVENARVSWKEISSAEARTRPDIQQFFGDKYGDVVRVVQIGGKEAALDGYSMELCGGTHTSFTGEIGLFRILGEAAIAAGIRRIEAITGMEAWARTAADASRLEVVAEKLGAPVLDIEKRLDALLISHKSLEKKLAALRQQQAASMARELLSRVESVAGVPLLAVSLSDTTGDELQQIAFALKPDFNGVLFLAGQAEGRVHLVAQVHCDVTSRFQAGKILQAVAPLVGGKGGGKPDFARGAGSDPSGIESALSRVKELLNQHLIHS